MKHHGGVLADRIKHDRVFAFSDHLAHDEDAFGLQPLEMAYMVSDGERNWQLSFMGAYWAKAAPCCI